MKPTEINPSEYNSYYQKYIDLVDDVSLSEALEMGLHDTPSFFKNISQAKWHYRYAENKWTPKDILQHIIDTERVFAYRALYFSRADNANLEGFDENIFAQSANGNNKSINNLLEEYSAVRNASFHLFKNFNEIELKRTGIANNSVMSVAAAGFIICGHEIHHQNIINERYL